MLTYTIHVIKLQNDLGQYRQELAKASRQYRSLLKTFGEDNGFVIGAHNRVLRLRQTITQVRQALSK